MLALSTIYVIYYRFEIDSFKEMSAKNIIFIVWLILMLTPVFSDMEFLGIKVKREVDKAKKEIKEEIMNLKLDMLSFNIAKSESNIGIYLPEHMPTREKIDRSKENASDDTTSLEEMLSVSEQSIFLFKIRQTLETKLEQLSSLLGIEARTLPQTIERLAQFDIFSYDDVTTLNEIRAICNRGIHGEIVSDEYVRYVNIKTPSLIEKIDFMIENYSQYFHLCDNCGNIFKNHDRECPVCGAERK